jgi:hypothetical protein
MGATLISYDDDTLVFERAFVARDEAGQLVPRCFFSGIPCQLGTKETTVAAGFVACWPLEARLQENWPMSVKYRQDTGVESTLENCTGNPRAVAAVRRFLTLLESGEPAVGTAL